MELKLSKDEAIFVFNALENIGIKGKDATLMVGIFDKLNSYIIDLHKMEQENESRLKIATESGVDPNLLVKE